EVRPAQPEGVHHADYEPGHRPRSEQRVPALRVTEPGQVDGDQPGVAGQHGPDRREREQGLRPRAEQQGFLGPLPTAGTPDGESFDDPEPDPERQVQPDGHVPIVRLEGRRSPPPGGQSRRVQRSSGMAWWSWPRELIPSLVNTLLRWYWTVRLLRNSR